jgi:hypothetical protein
MTTCRQSFFFIALVLAQYVFLHSCMGGKREMEALACKKQLRRVSIYLLIPSACCRPLVVHAPACDKKSEEEQTGSGTFFWVFCNIPER